MYLWWNACCDQPLDHPSLDEVGEIISPRSPSWCFQPQANWVMLSTDSPLKPYSIQARPGTHRGHATIAKAYLRRRCRMLRRKAGSEGCSSSPPTQLADWSEGNGLHNLLRHTQGGKRPPHKPAHTVWEPQGRAQYNPPILTPNLMRCLDIWDKNWMEIRWSIFPHSVLGKLWKYM